MNNERVLKKSCASDDCHLNGPSWKAVNYENLAFDGPNSSPAPKLPPKRPEVINVERNLTKCNTQSEAMAWSVIRLRRRLLMALVGLALVVLVLGLTLPFLTPSKATEKTFKDRFRSPYFDSITDILDHQLYISVKTTKKYHYPVSSFSWRLGPPFCPTRLGFSPILTIQTWQSGLEED